MTGQRALEALDAADLDREMIYQLAAQAVVERHQRESSRAKVVDETTAIKVNFADPGDYFVSELTNPTLVGFVDEGTIRDWVLATATRHNIGRSLRGLKGASVTHRHPCDAECFGGTAPPHITLTAAGLNASRTKAMVWAQYYCGSLCGNPHWVLLEKIDGLWAVANVETMGEY
jgi:hypothetical protein